MRAFRMCAAAHVKALPMAACDDIGVPGRHDYSDDWIIVDDDRIVSMELHVS